MFSVSLVKMTAGRQQNDIFDTLEMQQCKTITSLDRVFALLTKTDRRADKENNLWKDRYFFFSIVGDNKSLWATGRRCWDTGDMVKSRLLDVRAKHVLFRRKTDTCKILLSLY